MFAGDHHKVSDPSVTCEFDSSRLKTYTPIFIFEKDNEKVKKIFVFCLVWEKRKNIKKKKHKK